MSPDPQRKSRVSHNQTREVVDPSIVKALSHPVRAQALAILNERIASPNEIAQELDQGVGHVSYHINVLKKCECIELIDTASRRGAVEHYYRATSPLSIDVDAWGRLPASVRPSLSATLLQDLIKDVGTALSAGTFESRHDRHLAWTPMILDETGWTEAGTALRGLLKRVLEIQAASAERLAKADEAGIQVSIASMAYETPASSERRPTPQLDS